MFYKTFQLINIYLFIYIYNSQITYIHTYNNLQNPHNKQTIANNRMTNRLKISLLTTPKQHQQHRLYIQQAQVKQYWQSCTLSQMQQILSIKQQKIVQHIWHYFSYYLSNKKNISIKDAYYVRNNQRILMCFYDCRIFKSITLHKQDNQMLSAFIIGYKQQYQQQQQQKHSQQFSSIKDLYQFINPKIFKDNKLIFKCKASYLLKLYPLFKSLNFQTIHGDTAILTQEYYFKFLYSWMHFSQSIDVQPMVRHLFRGLMILMQNQILLAYSKTLSPKQKQVRKYQKPVAIFQKPKLKQTSTMVQEGLGDIEWNTLKISAFKFKYKVIESDRSYVCYRVKEEDQFNTSIHQKFNQMSQEDIKIVCAFDLLRGNQEIYEENVYY